MQHRILLFAALLIGSINCVSSRSADDGDLPANRWVELCKDERGARRGSGFVYAPAARTFLLWGFQNADYDLLQQNTSMPTPEYDMVAFDWSKPGWRDRLPTGYEEKWKAKRPDTWMPRTYSGITTGSERSLFRAPPGKPDAPPRPDPNIVFDQLAYHPPSKSIVYFTGGLTVAYNVVKRRWRDLEPKHAPPPVIGGALAYNPVHDEMVLFGGGGVVEHGPGGRPVGYTGTWVYSFKDRDWRQLELERSPPPRMDARLVTDTKNKVLVLFGGDGQSHYRADTWLFDLKTRAWRQVKGAGPPPRAGHLAAFDPATCWTLVGGGYNRDNLTDLWAFDAGAKSWRRLAGRVPTGFCVAGDFDPERRVLLLTTSRRRANDSHGCNVLFPVRTTYAYKLDAKTAALPEQAVKHADMPKRPNGMSGQDFKLDDAGRRSRAEFLNKLPEKRWVPLPAKRVAPTRTWGSATFDSARGRILYWGGGHCGYGGSDVDMFDVATGNWISSNEAPDYPQRLWNLGVRLAGVTFNGNPWTTHGRRVYAFDPVSKKMISVRPIQLTTGYVPDVLREFPGAPTARVDARVKPPTSYRKYVTWEFDPDKGVWELAGPAPAGLDTLVTTPHGVMGVPVNWPTRLKDSGYQVPVDPDEQKDNAVFVYDASKKIWQRLGKKQAAPQNLYEMTTLVYDTKRDRLLLHGGGPKRDELWAFTRQTGTWTNLKPKVAGNATTPACMREGVYLPAQDVMLTYGRGQEGQPELWAYHAGANEWGRIETPLPPDTAARQAAGQNRALVYDPKRDLVLLVLGGGGDRGRTSVFALKHRPKKSEQKR